MNESKLPAEDRRISAAYGCPYLQFYKGIFDCVYIALNPFVIIPGTDPNSLTPATLNSASLPEPLTLDLINQIAAEWREIHARDPAIIANAEKQYGQRVAWETISTASGLATVANVNRALLSGIHAIREPFRDDSGAERLSSYCASHKIFLPDSDFIPPILEPSIANLLKELGHEQTVLSDKTMHFDEVWNQRLIPTDTLVAEERVWNCAGVVEFGISTIYPPDNSFLIYVPYDGYITIICGKENSLRELELDKTFEGFWADEQTDDNWWLTDEELLRIAQSR